MIEFHPTEDQIRYTEDIIERMDKNFKNDWKSSNHKDNKWWGKLAEVIAADYLGVDRPHLDKSKKIVPDLGYDLIYEEIKIDVKSQKNFDSGLANCNVSCTVEKRCDKFMFFHHDTETYIFTLLGEASFEDVKKSEIVKGRFSPMHQVKLKE